MGLRRRLIALGDIIGGKGDAKASMRLITAHVPFPHFFRMAHRQISWDSKKAIIIKDDLAKEYLTKAGVATFEELTVPQAETLFRSAISDFKNGKISSDTLADLGFHLFHGVAKRHLESNLFDATEAASELSFAIRSPAVYRSIAGYLEEIDRFYKKEKVHIARAK